MKIELKSINHSPSLSEETEAFTANLYIDDKHAGYAKNSGHGGPTDYYANDQQGAKLIKDAEAFCKALPPKEYPGGDGMKPFSVAMDLEGLIDELLYEHLKQKDLIRFNNQLNKAMQNGVVFGVPEKSFEAITYKMPLATVMAHPEGREKLKEMIAREILPELKEGVIILNTNIPETVLKEAGLKPDQYRLPSAETNQELKPGPSKKPGRKI